MKRSLPIHPPTEAPDVVPLRRNRRFQLLWAGAATSMLGSQLTKVATPLLILQITGSASQAGIVSSALTVSLLATTIPAGVWVDRSDRRRALLSVQALQFLNGAALAGTLLLGREGLASFIAFAVIEGGCQAFLGPAREVAIRNVVPAQQLRQAFTQEEARSYLAWLAGPALGGILYTAGAVFPFVLDAVSFLVAWVCTVVSKVPRRPAATGEAQPEASGNPETATRRSGMARETAEAARWVLRQPGLREMTVVIMAMNLLGGAYSIPVIVHIRELGGSSALTGLVLTGTGVGGLLGAALSGHLTRRVPAGALAILVPAIFGAGMLAAALPLAAWWPIVPIVAFSLFIPSLNIANRAIRAQLVPADMLGRLSALIGFTSFGLAPLGPLLGGILSDRLGGGPTLACVGTGLLLTAGGAACSRKLRSFRASAP